MSNEEVVRIEDRRDRWRFVCPLRHRSWEPTNHHFWCSKCAGIDGVDGAFQQLRDRKSGRRFDRSEVRLLTAAGPYDRQLDGEGSA